MVRTALHPVRVGAAPDKTRERSNFHSPRPRAPVRSAHCPAAGRSAQRGLGRVDWSSQAVSCQIKSNTARRSPPVASIDTASIEHPSHAFDFPPAPRAWRRSVPVDTRCLPLPLRLAVPCVQCAPVAALGEGEWRRRAAGRGWRRWRARSWRSWRRRTRAASPRSRPSSSASWPTPAWTRQRSRSSHRAPAPAPSLIPLRPPRPSLLLLLRPRCPCALKVRPARAFRCPLHAMSCTLPVSFPATGPAHA